MMSNSTPSVLINTTPAGNLWFNKLGILLTKMFRRVMHYLLDLAMDNIIYVLGLFVIVLTSTVVNLKARYSGMREYKIWLPNFGSVTEDERMQHHRDVEYTTLRWKRIAKGILQTMYAHNCGYTLAAAHRAAVMYYLRHRHNTLYVGDRGGVYFLTSGGKREYLRIAREPY